MMSETFCRENLKCLAECGDYGGCIAQKVCMSDEVMACHMKGCPRCLKDFPNDCPEGCGACTPYYMCLAGKNVKYSNGDCNSEKSYDCMRWCVTCAIGDGDGDANAVAVSGSGSDDDGFRCDHMCSSCLPYQHCVAKADCASSEARGECRNCALDCGLECTSAPCNKCTVYGACYGSDVLCSSKSFTTCLEDCAKCGDEFRGCPEMRSRCLGCYVKYQRCFEPDCDSPRAKSCQAKLTQECNSCTSYDQEGCRECAGCITLSHICDWDWNPKGDCNSPQYSECLSRCLVCAASDEVCPYDCRLCYGFEHCLKNIDCESNEARTCIDDCATCRGDCNHCMSCIQYAYCLIEGIGYGRGRGSGLQMCWNRLDSGEARVQHALAAAKVGFANHVQMYRAAVEGGTPYKLPEVKRKPFSHPLFGKIMQYKPPRRVRGLRPLESPVCLDDADGQIQKMGYTCSVIISALTCDGDIGPLSNGLAPTGTYVYLICPMSCNRCPTGDGGSSSDSSQWGSEWGSGWGSEMGMGYTYPGTPTCTAYGDYEVRQCDAEGKCWCVEQTMGMVIKQASDNETCAEYSLEKMQCKEGSAMKCAKAFRSWGMCDPDMLDTIYAGKEVTAPNGNKVKCAKSLANCGLTSCKSDLYKPTECVAMELARVGKQHPAAKGCIVSSDEHTGLQEFMDDILDMVEKDGEGPSIESLAIACGRCFMHIPQGALKDSQCVFLTAVGKFLRDEICSHPDLVELINYQRKKEKMSKVKDDCLVQGLEDIANSAKLPSREGVKMKESCQSALKVARGSESPSHFEAGCGCAVMLSEEPDFLEEMVGPESDNFCPDLLEGVHSYTQTCQEITGGCVKPVMEEVVKAMKDARPNGEWDSCSNLAKLGTDEAPRYSDMETSICTGCVFPLQEALDSMKEEGGNKEDIAEAVSVALFETCPAIPKKLKSCPRFGKNKEKAAKAASCLPATFELLQKEFGSYTGACGALEMIAKGTLQGQDTSTQATRLDKFCNLCLPRFRNGVLDPTKARSLVDGKCEAIVDVLGKAKAICEAFKRQSSTAKVRAVRNSECANAKHLVETSCPGLIPQSGNIVLSAKAVAFACGQKSCLKATKEAAKMARKCLGDDALWAFVLETVCMKAPLMTKRNAQGRNIQVGGEYCAPFIFPELAEAAPESTPCEHICESECSGGTCHKLADCETACKDAGCRWFNESVSDTDTRCQPNLTPAMLEQQCHWCVAQGAQAKMTFLARLSRSSTSDVRVMMANVESDYKHLRQMCFKVGEDFCQAKLASVQMATTGDVDFSQACKPAFKGCLNAWYAITAEVMTQNERPFLDAMQSALCLQNRNGKFCGEYFHDMYLSTKSTGQVYDCIAQFVNAGTCSETCAKALGDFFREAGCCRGTLHSMLQKMGSTGIGVYKLGRFLRNGLGVLADTCGAKLASAKQDIVSAESCTLKKGTKKEKIKLVSKLDCSVFQTYFQHSPSRLESLQSAFEGDMSANTGGAKEFFSDTKFSCASGNTRHFGVLQSSTMVIETSLQAEDDAATQAAAQNFAKAASNNEVDLARAGSLVTSTTGETLSVDSSATQQNVAPSGDITTALKDTSNKAAEEENQRQEEFRKATPVPLNPGDPAGTVMICWATVALLTILSALLL